jgi:hypothetical protein
MKDDADGLVLGPKELVSMLGEKLYSSSELCLRKLQSDIDIAPTLMCPY